MDIFFELLQASIGTRRSLSRRPTADEWRRLMDTSVQHGLTALAALARRAEQMGCFVIHFGI